MIEMNEKRYLEALEGNAPVLVEFQAPWCVRNRPSQARS